MKLSSLFGLDKTEMVDSGSALPGRDHYDFEIPAKHTVLGTSLRPPFPDNVELAYFALGCFWGAERLFWQKDGVYSTAVGYMGGLTPYPTYREVCSGKTGHAEAVMVAYDPEKIGYEELVTTFFDEHDPTQGMRQGNDVGTQYRSAIYTTSQDQLELARQAAEMYGPKLQESGFGKITTEIASAGPFYYAEPEHQQYLDKNPAGYCGLDGTGVSCPVPWLAKKEESMDDTLPQTEEEWRERLTPEQFQVLRQSATERPFTGQYLDSEDDGIYRCAACGNPLFDSDTKFHSGSGWPSFTEAIPGSVELIEDRTHGMVRTEARCARCHSHLGHVFDDGPRDQGGQRWCMNGCALDLSTR